MSRTLTKTVGSAFEEPIFILRCLRIANGWCNNCDLVHGMYTLPESILAIALLKCTLTFNSHTNNQLQGVWTEDRGVLFGLCPKTIFMRKGFIISSGLIVRMHMVGTARGVPFSLRAQYCDSVSLS
jgi:hypothetical protein